VIEHKQPYGRSTECNIEVPPPTASAPCALIVETTTSALSTFFDGFVHFIDVLTIGAGARSSIHCAPTNDDRTIVAIVAPRSENVAVQSAVHITHEGRGE